MNISPENLRLCLVNADNNNQVIFLPQPLSQHEDNSLPVHDESGGVDALLSAKPYAFDVSGHQVVYAVIRTNGQWEQPCIVDYPRLIIPLKRMV